MFYHSTLHITVHCVRKNTQNFLLKMIIFCYVVMGDCREVYNHRTSIAEWYIIIELFFFYFQVLTTRSHFDWKSIFKVFQIHSSILSKSISNTFFFRSIFKYYLKYFKVFVYVFLFEIHFQLFLPITEADGR